MANICLLYIVTTAINMDRGFNYIFYQYSYILVFIKEERSNSNTALELKVIKDIFQTGKSKMKETILIFIYMYGTQHTDKIILFLKEKKGVVNI